MAAARSSPDGLSSNKCSRLSRFVRHPHIRGWRYTTIKEPTGVIRQWRWRVVALTLVAFSNACDKAPRLPTAPSELLTGIVVYEHANFLGASAHITNDIS